MSYLTAIGTAAPAHRFDQSTLSDFMVRAMALDTAASRKLRTLFHASGIDHRYSVLEDYGRSDNFDFYANTPDLEPFPSTQRRQAMFRQYAPALSVAAVNDMLSTLPHFDVQGITHLIVVSCTGMYAPGLDIELVQALGLRSTVQRTCITFMGCYAAFNALKVADAFCTARPENKVLIVCTELCSLHFQREATTDNLLANALFADGSAAVLIEGKPQPGLSLKLEGFHSDLALQGANDMAWSIGDFGFEMRLSAYVPSIIKDGIATLAAALLDRLSKKLPDIDYFAIHPGGKKILETIAQQLGLQQVHMAPAYQVLKDFGNMSSPTVLFVLKAVFHTLREQDHGKSILSFAFGPGLTLESMLFQIENRKVYA